MPTPGAADVTPTGPLRGVRVVELAGLGPAPFGCMLLADMGAEVVRVERVEAVGGRGNVDRVLNRGRRSIAVDLKHPAGVRTVLRLTDAADVFVEGFRPGVAERLGVGPEALLARNPRLVYGRMTGWGQDGPNAAVPGHDINFLALSGVLHGIGPAERPVVPANLIADFGGGGALLAMGVVAALLERAGSGRGQVVDAAMIDGAGQIATAIHGMDHEGAWGPQREANLLDGGAPFYGAYATSDGRFVAVGAVEPQFYATLLDALGLDPAELGDQHDRSRWRGARRRIAAVFATRTRDEWCAQLTPLEACVTPVLTLEEARRDSHQRARDGFVTVDGDPVPAPAPRFGRTPSRAGAAPVPLGADTDRVLREAGLDDGEIGALRADGVIG